MEFPRNSNRDKAVAAEFRELVGMDFDEFTRQAPVRVLLALSKFARPMKMTVLQFADEMHPLVQQQRASLARALRYACSVRTWIQRSGGGRLWR